MAKGEGRPTIQVAPASIVGLGAAAFTSVASIAATILMTTTNRVAYEYFPKLSMVSHVDTRNLLLLLKSTRKIPLVEYTEKYKP